MSDWTIVGVIVITVGVISLGIAALFYFSAPILLIYPVIAGIIFLAIGFFMLYQDRVPPYSG